MAALIVLVILFACLAMRGALTATVEVRPLAARATDVGVLG